MTVEAILAAMAFIANADRRSGNHPDYELEDNNSSLGYLGDIGNIIPGVSIKED